MILIPEIETVVILVPRTGSGSLRRAIAQRYPQAMLIYRHMEADGIPIGYDRWKKIGVLRHPVHRLWSLYKFLNGYMHPSPETGRGFLSAMQKSVQLEFNDWIVDNEIVFTGPYDREGSSRYFPKFTVRHNLPENRKSQFLYLRPDLGTTIFRFDNLARLAACLDLPALGFENKTDSNAGPELTAAAMDHVQRFFGWDLDEWVSRSRDAVRSAA